MNRGSHISMETGQPYISVVVTARNDDHGGNLLGRMQIFVNGWIEQARRYNLSSELIIVEWNPPAGRPRLHEALRWPDDFGPCAVRFIEVPEELHRRWAHAEALPLYQMIAKNVGIRRATARFVLATNIDILFSDELMAFLAEQRLQPDRMYRIDRHDAMSDVPMDASVEEQLAYCRTHLLRVNAREGTFPLTPDGARALAKEDIAAANSGFAFSHGWFPVERYGDGEIFRWVDNDAEIRWNAPAESRVLRLELEPGPGMGGRPMTLQVYDGARLAMSGEITRRSLLRIPSSLLEPGADQIRLRIEGGGDVVAHDPRILNLRVFSCAWERAGGGRSGVTGLGSLPVRAAKRLMRIWHQFQWLLNRLAASDFFMTITIAVPPRLRRLASAYVGWGGFTGMFLNWTGYVWRKVRFQASPAPKPAAVVRAPQESTQVAFLHTNACGDFTLAARERWFDLRAYPEFDLYSMNIDSVFCYAAHHGGVTEEVLPEPMRIYHIEHAAGSGWTPEGESRLFARIAAKGLGFVSYQDLVSWAVHMRRLGCPMIFNHDDWGLAGFELGETTPAPAASQRRWGRAGESN